MIEDYTEKMSDELNHLNKENQAYVKKMVAYIGVKSFFYDDELLGEQLYNMVCDLKVAERDGIGAMDYYGKDPREMMDQVLSELPRRRLGSYVRLFLILGTHAVCNGFCLDDATGDCSLNISARSTHFRSVQSIHDVALVQTELWGNQVALGSYHQYNQSDLVS